MTSLIHLPLAAIVVVVAILFAAGMTKGVIGIGLPIVAVPLLSTVVAVPTAVAIVAIPLLLTNLSQACRGEAIPLVLKELWPILAGTAAGLIGGVHLLTSLGPSILKPVVGIALIAIAALMLLAPKAKCPDRFAPVAGPLVGVGGGVLGGLAGQSGPIVFLYLLSRGINGNRFVQYSSMYITVTAVALTLALSGVGAIGLEGAIVSTICTIPILLGMWVGQWVREVVSAGLFRKLVLGMIILGGVSMTVPAMSMVFATARSASAEAARGIPAMGRVMLSGAIREQAFDTEGNHDPMGSQ
jgi:uncharacterized membrane protein YfcA